MLVSSSEALKARVRANAWHQEMCIEYGLEPDPGATADGSRYHVSKTPYDVAAAIHEPGVRRWLVDTGCPFDLIAHKELDAHEESFIKKATKLIRLSTPNGIVDADKVVSFRIPMLDGNIDAHVMKSSPTVMSIGRRCMTMGYGFVWRPGRNPFMITNTGKRIHLEVIDYIPYLPVTKSIACAAGVSKTVDGNENPELAEEADAEAGDTYEVIDCGKRDLKAEAVSVKHLLTHLPKNPFCETCVRAKMENAKSKQKGGVTAHGFTKFGEHVTADTIVLHGIKDRGIGNKNNAIVMFDFGTGWLSCHPVRSRSEEDTMEAFRDFVGPKDKVVSFYSDGAPEITACAKAMRWYSDTSTPGVPRNNSVAENKVKLVINGARCLLLQAGLPSKFWPFASQAFCNGVNTVVVDGDSKYHKRHGEGHFPGKFIPFGCLVDYYPTKRTFRQGGSSSSKDREFDREDDVEWEEVDSDVPDKEIGKDDTNVVSKTLAEEIDPGTKELPKFSPRGVPGIFLGHRMSPGGVWKGEYYVANLSDLRAGKRAPRIQRVRSILVDDRDGYLFPMRDLYDFVQRSGLYKNARPVDTDEDVTEQSTFEYDASKDGDFSSGAEQAEKKTKDEESAMTDYWEINRDEGIFVYHHTMMRKRMFVPHKSEDGPAVHELDTVRTTKGKYSNGETFVITDDWSMKGAQRSLPKHWSGATVFYAKGKAPVVETPKPPEESVSVVVPPVAIQPAKESIRKERKYKGSSKPNWIDSASWVSMSPAVRRHLIQQEKAKQPISDAETTNTSSSSHAAPAEPEKRHFDEMSIRADIDGDLIVESVCAKDKTTVYVCSRRRVVIPGGAHWEPKGLTIDKMPKKSWGTIMGLPCDAKHPRTEFYISCNVPSSEKSSRGSYIPKIVVYSDKAHDIVLQPNQRIGILKIFRCAEVANYRVCINNNDMDMDHLPACSGVTTDSDSGGVPSMPVIDAKVEHRPKINAPHVYSACVARPVTKKEARETPKAMAALDKEWNKLRNMGCWDETRVEEWQAVATRAKRGGTKVHIGRIFDICVEKNSELDENDPNRKFKGRVVFEGCYVKDEDNNWAIFSEIASCPASMEASRCADAFGLLPGHSIQIADGESAYTQAKLGGDLTYIRIPRERWPEGWANKYKDPVVPLILALYGHPDAGGFWELHCEKSLLEVGFTRAAPEWKSVFRHDKLDLLLVIYVDDFKLAGPAKNLAQGWKLISSKIKMEPAQPIGRFLGCQQSIGSMKMHAWSNPRYEWMRSTPPKKDPPLIFNDHEKELMNDTSQPMTHVNVMQYDMSNFLEQCVQRYVELAGNKMVGKIKPAPTPFLDESKPEFDENEIIAKIKAGRKAAQESEDDIIVKGAAFSQGGGMLANIASAVLMKILYAARMGRFDLLRPVTALGSRITTWTKLCDARLHRLVCYIKGTLDLKMYGWVGDTKDKLELVLYCDADLAGDRTDAKSTSGIFMCVVGPTSFVPLAAVSKKQTSVSKSTPEAEIVAIDHGMSKHALPALSLWENILGRKLTVKLMEDNSAACRVVITGRNPSMRHMSRTQRIDIAWLNERYAEKSFAFVECPSEFQAGDLMTKHFTDARVWLRNLHLVGHFKDDVFHRAFVKVSNTAAATSEELTKDQNETEVESEATASAAATYIPQRFAPQVKEAKTHVYTLIEYCAYLDSLLGDPTFHHGLCRTVCIDENVDGRSHKAMELCKLVCERDKRKVVLWGSLPCTGGCTWNYINALNPGGPERIAEHVKTMKQLLTKFIYVARMVKRHDGVIIFEWPLRCTYWKRNDVMSMISELGLQPTHVHGCSLGLKSSNKGNEHMFLKKPWAIYSNCPDIHNTLRKFTCPGVTVNHVHDQCRGKNAKESERYTALFAKSVHKALRRHFEYEQ